MNQVSNLVQWKNHTDDEKDEFDFEKYSYQYQAGSGIWQPFTQLKDGKRRLAPDGQYVYRLKIEPEKWYAIICHAGKYITPGSNIQKYDVASATLLRPAKPSDRNR